MLDEPRYTCWMILVAGLLECERTHAAEERHGSGVWRLGSAAQSAEAGPQEIELTPVGGAKPLRPLDA
jgi:hypothetical protein